MGTIILVYFTTKPPENQDFRVTKSLPECMFWLNIWFKSRLLNTFVLSLQSKETQKVHQRFQPFSGSEHKKSGPEAADRPLRSPISLNFARFSPKMQEETSFALVDKRGFFDGGEGGI